MGTAFWMVSVRPVAVAVAGALRTKVVALVTEATVAPAGMPLPTMVEPTLRALVLATVTVVEALVVAPLVRVWPLMKKQGWFMF